MSPTIASIQLGAVLSEGDRDSRDVTDRYWTTAFYKHPVASPVRLNRLGLAGDAVADTRHHGGPDKAVLCYAARHYQEWAKEHPELNMAGGALGENLTIDNADESSVCIGDRWRIGQCLVQISQPRQPCWKISRRWRVKTLTKEVTQTGRTGWYLRVLEEGLLSIGQTCELVDRPHERWPIQRLNDIMFGREIDRLAVIELMGISALAEAWKRDIA